MLRQEEYNIARTFKPEEFKYFRERMISMILNTDMVNHFTEISKLKGRLASPGIYIYINNLYPNINFIYLFLFLLFRI